MQPGERRLHHRAERRRQDDAVQPDHRRLRRRQRHASPVRPRVTGLPLTSARIWALRAPTRSSRCSARTRCEHNVTLALLGLPRLAMERISSACRHYESLPRSALRGAGTRGLGTRWRTAAERDFLWREAPRGNRHGAGADAARAAARRAAGRAVGQESATPSATCIAAIPRETSRIVMIEHDMEWRSNSPTA